MKRLFWTIHEYHTHSEYNELATEYHFRHLSKTDKPRVEACKSMHEGIEDEVFYLSVCNNKHSDYGMPAIMTKSSDEGFMCLMRCGAYYTFHSPYWLETYYFEQERERLCSALHNFTILNNEAFITLFDNDVRKEMIRYSDGYGRRVLYPASYESNGMLLPAIIDTSLEQGELRYMKTTYYREHFMKDRTYVSFDGFVTNPDNWDGGLKLV